MFFPFCPYRSGGFRSLQITYLLDDIAVADVTPRGTGLTTFAAPNTTYPIQPSSRSDSSHAAMGQRWVRIGARIGYRILAYHLSPLPIFSYLTTPHVYSYITPLLLEGSRVPLRAFHALQTPSKPPNLPSPEYTKHQGIPSVLSLFFGLVEPYQIAFREALHALLWTGALIRATIA